MATPAKLVSVAGRLSFVTPSPLGFTCTEPPHVHCWSLPMNQTWYVCPVAEDGRPVIASSATLGFDGDCELSQATQATIATRAAAVAAQPTTNARKRRSGRGLAIG